MRPALFPRERPQLPPTGKIARQATLGAVRCLLDRLGATGKCPATLARSLRRRIDRCWP